MKIQHHSIVCHIHIVHSSAPLFCVHNVLPLISSAYLHQWGKIKSHGDNTTAEDWHHEHFLYTPPGFFTFLKLDAWGTTFSIRCYNLTAKWNSLSHHHAWDLMHGGNFNLLHACAACKLSSILSLNKWTCYPKWWFNEAKFPLLLKEIPWCR